MREKKLRNALVACDVNVCFLPIVCYIKPTFEEQVEIRIAFGIKMAVDLFSMSSISTNAITSYSLDSVHDIICYTSLLTFVIQPKMFALKQR